ncbi:MAG: flagellar biosynthesis anti-sigma factor FlgM [Proteobacteria bacterium]|nr:MAG: flagellar biosynthesis anti-sigma factor FlgM [Pseudomonadota bacterium]
MKIVSNIPTRDAATAVTETTPAGKTGEAACATPPGAAAPARGEALQSAVLQPTLQALREMPEIDAARVAELREKLARGELPFNPARLAALIEAYHRGGR